MLRLPNRIAGTERCSHHRMMGARRLELAFETSSNMKLGLSGLQTLANFSIGQSRKGLTFLLFQDRQKTPVVRLPVPDA